MKIATALLLAIVYAALVFCVCSAKKIRTVLAEWFSEKDVRYLRETEFESPIRGRDVPDEIKRAVEPMLCAWRDADEKALPGRMDKTFLARMRRIIAVLRKHGVRRELKLIGTFAEVDGKGRRGFKKWNEVGREWRECVLSSAALDTVKDAQSGRILREKYYPNVRISVVQSRRIRLEDARQEAKNRKDKFGYTKKKQPETVFYEETRTIECNSCGAQVEINTQQVACPYCGAQLISEFHDWQTEHFAVEPTTEYPFGRVLVCTLIAFIASFAVRLTEALVSRSPDLAVWPSLIVLVLTVAAIAGYRSVLNAVQKKRKRQIVRFSEHQFKRCMYEELWSQFRDRDVVDFFIGDPTVKAVKNTDDLTELTVSAPLFTQICPDGTVTFKKTKWTGVFTRARYPERAKSKGALVEERECPSCGGNFIPDANGCCSFCGYSYKTDTAKWRLR